MPGVMLALEMGCGKSKAAVDLISNYKFAHTLLIAPLSVVDGVWANQFKTHAGCECIVTILGKKAGSVAKKLERAKQDRVIAESRNIPHIVVINYESVWLEPFAAWALKAPWDCLVLDECHKIKSAGGKASLFCARLGRHIPKKLGLTGTPMPHSPLDIYAQYRCLDPSIFGTSITAFKHRYAIMGGYGGYEVKGWQHQDELNQKMYSIAYRVTKDEVLDLPEVQDIRQYCALDKKALDLYEALEEDLVAEIEAGTITATNALVKLLRLQQITSGFVKLENGTEQQIDTNKQELLDEIFEEIADDEPLVVFCRFRHDLSLVQALAKKHNRPYAEVSGRKLPGVMGLDEWQQGQATILGIQIQAGGVGVDCSRARYCVYYSLGFSLGDYEQSRARVHRPGQTQNVVYYHLLATGTVDEKVYQALADKQNVVDSILLRTHDDEEGSDENESGPAEPIKGWQRLD